jgi:hypothetical protein
MTRSPGGRITRSPDSHVHSSQTIKPVSCKTSPMTSQTLAGTLEGFLSGSTGAVVVEDGAVVFNLVHAQYSVSGETSKCLLHLWSEAQHRAARPRCGDERRNSPRHSAKNWATAPYQVGHPSRARFRDSFGQTRGTCGLSAGARAGSQKTLPGLDRSAAQHRNLEKSFGPIYRRGLVKRGLSAFAILGVNRQELQASIDAALTFGILWLILAAPPIPASWRLKG